MNKQDNIRIRLDVKEGALTIDSDADTYDTTVVVLRTLEVMLDQIEKETDDTLSDEALMNLMIKIIHNRKQPAKES